MRNLGEETCEIVQSRLDAYLDCELGGEMTANVARHLEFCGDCSETADTILRTKKLLRRAVLKGTAPNALRRKIQKQIRAEFRGFGFLFAC